MLLPPATLFLPAIETVALEPEPDDRERRPELSRRESQLRTTEVRVIASCCLETVSQLSCRKKAESSVPPDSAIAL